MQYMDGGVGVNLGYPPLPINDDLCVQTDVRPVRRRADGYSLLHFQLSLRMIYHYHS
jgi:hypothetical protein